MDWRKLLILSVITCGAQPVQRPTDTLRTMGELLRSVCMKPVTMRRGEWRLDCGEARRKREYNGGIRRIQGL